MAITIGIDEVGRGPLAGPLCIGAVALEMDGSIEYPADIRDSKQISRRKRQEMASWIKENAMSWGLGWCTVDEIDNYGMSYCLKLAARRAYHQLSEEARRSASQIAIDGNMMMLEDPRAFTVIKGDDKIKAISAASIIAKVARDYYMMKKVAVEHPGYGFEHHVGYGTARHRAELEARGPIIGVHRLSCAPVARALGLNPKKTKKHKVEQTIGRKAEGVVANYLFEHGYDVIDRNWKTAECEIDLIAQKGNELYFTEVKYREDDLHGDGLAAITPRKLEQMTFAAKMYLHWHGLDQTGSSITPKLAVAALSGTPPTVDTIMPLDRGIDD